MTQNGDESAGVSGQSVKHNTLSTTNTPSNRDRSCATCGATRTLKGNKLTGQYCSPACLAIGNPARWDSNKEGRGHRLSEEQERYDSNDVRHAFNPFKGLFDDE